MAFTALVTRLVEDILMPIIAIPFGEPSFDAIPWEINGSIILIGSFLAALVAFLLAAIAEFLFIVKPYNAYKARSEEAEEDDEGPTEGRTPYRDPRSPLQELRANSVGDRT